MVPRPAYKFCAREGAESAESWRRIEAEGAWGTCTAVRVGAAGTRPRRTDVSVEVDLCLCSRGFVGDVRLHGVVGLKLRGVVRLRGIFLL